MSGVDDGLNRDPRILGEYKLAAAIIGNAVKELKWLCNPSRNVSEARKARKNELVRFLENGNGMLAFWAEILPNDTDEILQQARQAVRTAAEKPDPGGRSN
jgi:hypothetical protein